VQKKGGAMGGYAGQADNALDAYQTQDTVSDTMGKFTGK
jgi:hypothetical protein